jgi:(1->4)-alpha-D-glucan 1-alpha-D-glucosylmutase
MHIPTSTYRVQLHKDFNFSRLESLIDYISELGITTIYASPITTAVPGSMHGYDVIDPHSINPEIGTLEDFRRIASKLKEKKMTWIQDIVPNHMAFSPLNLRLMDVFERGPSSEFFHYFDINWTHPDPNLRGKVMVPILEAPLQDCIQNKKVKIIFDAHDGLLIDYAGNHFPLSTCAYNFLTTTCRQRNPAFLNDLADARKEAWNNSTYSEWQDAKMKYLQVLNGKEYELIDCIKCFNDDWQLMQQLLEKQYYFLSYWKDSNKKMNYRRFFTVNSLICLSMEHVDTFYDYHSFLLELYREGLIQGLRIDHIDGLNNPGEYIERLRELFGEDCYIIAEKILESKEKMPSQWNLQGTSGYEFLLGVGQVMTDKEGASELLNFYKKINPGSCTYEDTVYSNKRRILYDYMQGELENLVNLFYELGLGNKDFSRQNITEAIAAFMICLPVYRLYPEKFPLRAEELKIVNETIKKAATKHPDIIEELKFIQSLFTGDDFVGNALRDRMIFLRRLMQFTGPLTAKGVEDTTFYIYNPLISHNEVGDTPGITGITIPEFHAIMKERNMDSPLSLNSTATHDTKRGEDSRMRLNVLCEIADEWKEHVNKWREQNKVFIRKSKSGNIPSSNDEYFLYQSLVGGFPHDFRVTDEYRERLKTYFVKVLKEAKVRTSWDDPVSEYENGCVDFIAEILKDKSPFLQSFVPFIKKVSGYAALYTLNQTLIKITAPGIPDTYQGCELWDLSYVDPDNRRPVDYDSRQRFLGEIVTPGSPTAKVLPAASKHRLDFIADHRDEGLEKLYVTYHALNARKENAELFLTGEYIPLSASRERSTLVYGRRKGSEWMITITPLQVVKRAENASEFEKIYIELPKGAPQTFIDVISGKQVKAVENKLPLDELFQGNLPALLKGISEN